MKNYNKLLTLLFLAFCFFAKSQTGTWTQQISGTVNNLHTLFFVNQDTGYIANDNELYLTHNGGLSWTNTNVNPNCIEHYLNSWYNNRIFFVNDSTAFTTSGEVGVYETTDYGQTWNPIFTDNSLFWYCLEIRDSNMYVPALNQSQDSIFVFKSFDLGNSWVKKFAQTINIFNSTGDIAIKSVNDSVGFLSFIDNGGILFKTTDNFDSYNNSDTLTGVMSMSLYHSSFYNDSCGYFAGDAGELLKTCDLGTTWQSISVPTGGALQCDLVTLGSGTTFICGGAFNLGYIMSTVDGGNSWQIEYQSNEPVSQLFFVNESIAYAVGDNGKILKYNKSVGFKETDENESKLVIFPMPCSSTLFVNPGQSQSENNYSIHNTIGQELLNGKEKGTFQLNTENLTNGVYFIKLTSNNKTTTRKFIVQH